MFEETGNWFPVARLGISNTSQGSTATGGRRAKRSLKRRAKKKRICGCALRSQCRFICGSMQCPQRRKYKRKKY